MLKAFICSNYTTKFHLLPIISSFGLVAALSLHTLSSGLTTPQAGDQAGSAGSAPPGPAISYPAQPGPSGNPDTDSTYEDIGDTTQGIIKTISSVLWYGNGKQIQNL